MIVLSALLLATTPDPPPVPAPASTASAEATAVPSAPATNAATPPGTPAPTPMASPEPSGVSPLPSTSPLGTPSVSPSPAPSTTPSPYHYRFVPHPPPAGEPRIFAVYLNDEKLRSLGPIDIRVETSPEVVKVVSRSNGRDGIVPLLSPGVFVATGRLPRIPFIAEGMSIDIQFIATTADGRKTVVGVPVRLN